VRAKMTAKSASESSSSEDEDVQVIRFLQGAKLLGQTRLVKGVTLVEHGEAAGVTIPTNCTSGTCGACMVTLLDGDIPLPEILPPGLDDYLVESCARLGCIGIPTNDVDIDIRPPL
tara:strand:- start:30 stop:377 length:348 start_codon:yes stop_codon:yes gene_type:complete